MPNMTAKLIPGDANGDSRVDGSNVTILAGNWQAGVPNGDPENVTWAIGDFNGDGKVDWLRRNYPRRKLAVRCHGDCFRLPEPTAIALFFTALTAIGFFRLRKN